MTPALHAEGLGKRYGRRWALADVDLEIPRGRVVGLVGPNGAGKSTFLNLVTGQLAATAGTISVLGGRPGSDPAQLAKVGFVAQGTPTYEQFTVADHLRFGARLNPTWDGALARDRIRRLAIDPDQRAGELSGGQRAQLALTLGLAKRPDLLVLDEPVASLDPLARREFLQGLMEATAAQELTVVLSSHLVADLERTCDHVVLLVAGRVHVSGGTDELLATHRRLTGPHRPHLRLPSDQHLVWASHSDRQSTLVVRSDSLLVDPSWTVSELSLEDLVITYMQASTASAATSDVRSDGTRPGLEVLRCSG